MPLEHGRRAMADFRGRDHVVTIALVILLAVGAAGADEFVKGGKTNGCSAVKIAWGLHGLGTHMVPSAPLPGL